jgi:hypothetical protein
MKRLLVLSVALLAAVLLAACNPGDDEGGSFEIDLSGAPWSGERDL